MTEQEAKIIQTLHDAGCEDADIQKFLALRASGNNEKALRLLFQHRCSLICRMHEAQKPVDVLDYFLCELRKEQQAAK